MRNLTHGKVRRSHRRWPAGLAALLLMSLGGCQTAQKEIIRSAIEMRQAWWHHTGSFAHLLISRINNPDSDVLHVYIEGDGRPWIENRYIAKDPSPENPLALRLMMRDPKNSLYLGRPCYFTRYRSGDRGGDTSCRPAFWTSARYSERVVESMVATLEAFIERNTYSKVVLIGYSGGGTIAYLMAGRTGKINRVITVAANLDHSAWTRYHNYSPLQDSLEPIATSIPQSVGQLHLRGGRDRNVPGSVLKKFMTGDTARWITFSDYSHACCWEKNWPDILAAFVDDAYSSAPNSGPGE